MFTLRRISFSRFGILLESRKLPNLIFGDFLVRGYSSEFESISLNPREKAEKTEFGQIVLFSLEVRQKVKVKFPSKFSSPKIYEERRFKGIKCFFSLSSNPGTDIRRRLFLLL